MKPDDIEALSFSIIDREAGAHAFSPRQWAVVRRMIHTSADFEYKTSVRMHEDAIEAGISAIRNGAAIVTDTNMARVGIRSRDLAAFGNSVVCMMADRSVADAAAAQGVTRARAAVDAALGVLEGGIYVVGNAPTALLRLIELVGDGRAAPALIVGLPVGFVNAAESKEALESNSVPFITNRGRKGGSNVAAAVVNALILLAKEAEKCVNDKGNQR